jgi:hypothetical protein
MRSMSTLLVTHSRARLCYLGRPDPSTPVNGHVAAASVCTHPNDAASQRLIFES